MKRSVVMRASVSEMAAADVAGRVGQGRYDAVLRRDEHPMFVKLVVGVEGISKGALEIDGKAVDRSKRWYAPVIDELADALNFGSPGIHEGHDGRGAGDRARLGEVMGAYSEEREDGRRQATAIAFIQSQDVRPRIASGELCNCSVEADVVIAGIDSDEPFVQSVEEASAVVLAGKDETPGFEDSGVDAVIQELQSRHGRVDEMADKKPGEMFTRNELAEDSVVISLIQAGRETQYEDLKNTKAQLEKAQEDLKLEKEKVSKLEDDLKAAGSSANASRVKTEVEKQVDALKVTTQVKDAIKADLSSIEISDPAISDDDLAAEVKKHVDRGEATARRYAESYGVKPDAGASGSKDDDDGDDTTDDGEDEFLSENKLDAEGKPVTA